MSFGPPPRAASDSSGSAEPSGSRESRGGVSRRFFVQTLGVGAAAGSVGTAAEAWVGKTFPAKKDDAAIIGPDPSPITLNVNGSDVKLTVEPSTTLLEALRVHANLTGSKEVCDRGSCGACSVLVDGKLMVSCMMLAVDAVGTKITTVEGLCKGNDLDPVQAAFVKHDALQCGFCTPGLVMACKALLNGNPKPTLQQIKVGLSGNICRCGTYTNVFNAALEASGQEPVQDSAKPV